MLYFVRTYNFSPVDFFTGLRNRAVHWNIWSRLELNLCELTYCTQDMCRKEQRNRNNDPCDNFFFPFSLFLDGPFIVLAMDLKHSKVFVELI